MYNMIFGQSGNADILLAILNLTRGDFYRYRDCYFTEDGQIAVYTRAGGGNREDGEESRQVLMEHPAYLRDEDDDFDCTYATFYFKAPEGLSGVMAEPDRNDLWVTFLSVLEESAKKAKEQR